MIAPGDRSVAAPFSGTSFSYGGVTSRFTRSGDQFIVRTDGPDGALTDYPVAYTFGVDPLQQYLLRLPGGRLQALSIAWDTRPKAQGGQRWFHLYPAERVDHRDVLHWTGPAQNWNHMCAECHSTNVQKGYAADRDTFDTRWSEVNVSCEACHGPGSRHIEWARQKSPAGDRQKGFVFSLDGRSRMAWSFDGDRPIARPAAPLPSRSEVETCGRCHSRRSQIWPDYEYGRPLADTHRVALLEEGLYEADGQQLDEVYEYGSFLQSKMYAAGVTCSNCHNPHSGALVVPANGVCAQCHAPAKYDTSAHHFHKSGSAGAACASCHMPVKNYMVVHARRDHGFRIPRPDLTVSLGVPNACASCHRDKPATWAASAVSRWYPDAAHRPSYAPAIAAGRRQLPGADSALAALVNDRSAPAIIRATALSLLTPEPTGTTTAAMEAAVRDAETLVRRAAAERLAIVDVQTRLQLGPRLLADSVRTVRIESVPAMAAVPPALVSGDLRKTLDAAISEYRAVQQFGADRADSNVNLGALEADLGNAQAAEAAYRRAIRLQPQYAPAYVNLADLLRATAREEDAERVLREGLQRIPDVAQLHYALGLSLVRQKRTADALTEFHQAALSPDDARYPYVYAVALHDAGRMDDAMRTLAEAQRRHPADRDILQALVTYAMEQRDSAAALKWAHALERAAPNDRALAAQVRELEQRLNTP